MLGGGGAGSWASERTVDGSGLFCPVIAWETKLGVRGGRRGWQRFVTSKLAGTASGHAFLLLKDGVDSLPRP